MPVSTKSIDRFQSRLCNVSGRLIHGTESRSCVPATTHQVDQLGYQGKGTAPQLILRHRRQGFCEVSIFLYSEQQSKDFGAKTLPIGRLVSTELQSMRVKYNILVVSYIELSDLPTFVSSPSADEATNI